MAWDTLVLRLLGSKRRHKEVDLVARTLSDGLELVDERRFGNGVVFLRYRASS